MEEVPAGYEGFESPERGQVLLRKERPTCIASIEREIVVDGGFVTERQSGSVMWPKCRRYGERVGMVSNVYRSSPW